MLLLLAGFVLIALIDLIPLIRKRSWRGIVALLLLFIPALTLSILLMSNINVPSILVVIGNALKSIGISY